jgi:hypothetical protein
VEKKSGGGTVKIEIKQVMMCERDGELILCFLDQHRRIWELQNRWDHEQQKLFSRWEVIQCLPMDDNGIREWREFE